MGDMNNVSNHIQVETGFITPEYTTSAGVETTITPRGREEDEFKTSSTPSNHSEHKNSELLRIVS